MFYVVYGNVFGVLIVLIMLIGIVVVDILYGGIGNDVLLGVGGDDLLIGGNGVDCFVGGFGNDDLWFGGGLDRIVFNFVVEGVDRIDDFVYGEDYFEIFVFGFGGGLIVGGSVLVLSLVIFFIVLLN